MRIALREYRQFAAPRDICSAVFRVQRFYASQTPHAAFIERARRERGVMPLPCCRPFSFSLFRHVGC